MSFTGRNDYKISFWNLDFLILEAIQYEAFCDYVYFIKGVLMKMGGKGIGVVSVCSGYPQYVEICIGYPNIRKLNSVDGFRYSFDVPKVTSHYDSIIIHEQKNARACPKKITQISYAPQLKKIRLSGIISLVFYGGLCQTYAKLMPKLCQNDG